MEKMRCNGKTVEEIKSAFDWCLKGLCEHCAYSLNEQPTDFCRDEHSMASLALIHYLEAERDALLAEVQKVRPCMLCVHHDDCPHKFMGAKRADGRGYSKKGCWVYRGVAVKSDG